MGSLGVALVAALAPVGITYLGLLIWILSRLTTRAESQDKRIAAVESRVEVIDCKGCAVRRELESRLGEGCGA